MELSVNRKEKLFYTFQIQDYSAKSLRKMVDKHIDKEAKITTDKWMVKAANITHDEMICG